MAPLKMSMQNVIRNGRVEYKLCFDTDIIMEHINLCSSNSNPCVQHEKANKIKLQRKNLGKDLSCQICYICKIEIASNCQKRGKL